MSHLSNKSHTRSKGCHPNRHHFLNLTVLSLLCWGLFQHVSTMTWLCNFTGLSTRGRSLQFLLLFPVSEFPYFFTNKIVAHSDLFLSTYATDHNDMSVKQTFVPTMSWYKPVHHRGPELPIRAPSCCLSPQYKENQRQLNPFTMCQL